MLHNRRLLVAVTGGIAAYKTCELVRLLVKNRASVQVIMTESATRFVGPLTFEAITGKKVGLDLFAGEEGGHGHLDLARGMDLMAIAPATANCIGKLATGIADDLVTTVSLAITCPLLVCPAMNPKMYAHPAVQENIGKLKDRGVELMQPEEGPMAHPLEEPGVGRMPEPSRILDRICRLLPPDGPLAGKTITVTSGPTREAIDPVRVISNLSSGRMGYALAQEARRRGAKVHLISGAVDQPAPPGISVVHVESTREMKEAVEACFSESQVVIMAAAPADFRPRQVREQKLKKETLADGLALELQETEDILKDLSAKKGARLLVGFALETENGLKHARHKLKDKNLDLIILNYPKMGDDAGLGRKGIQGTIIGANGGEEILSVMPKEEFAGLLLDRIQQLLQS